MNKENRRVELKKLMDELDITMQNLQTQKDTYMLEYLKLGVNIPYSVGFKRLKASKFIKNHMKDTPYRFVIIELYYTKQEKKEYAITIESIDETDRWFSYTEFSSDFPDKEFYKMMNKLDINEDLKFKPDEEYSEWW